MKCSTKLCNSFLVAFLCIMGLMLTAPSCRKLDDRNQTKVIKTTCTDSECVTGCTPKNLVLNECNPLPNNKSEMAIKCFDGYIVVKRYFFNNSCSKFSMEEKFVLNACLRDDLTKQSVAYQCK